jgi:hypothetical protein
MCSEENGYKTAKGENDYRGNEVCGKKQVVEDLDYLLM